jgi:hypothetical protein
MLQQLMQTLIAFPLSTQKGWLHSAAGAAAVDLSRQQLQQQVPGCCSACCSTLLALPPVHDSNKESDQRL